MIFYRVFAGRRVSETCRTRAAWYRAVTIVLYGGLFSRILKLRSSGFVFYYSFFHFWLFFGWFYGVKVSPALGMHVPWGVENRILSKIVPKFSR